MTMTSKKARIKALERILARKHLLTKYRNPVKSLITESRQHIAKEVIPQGLHIVRKLDNMSLYYTGDPEYDEIRFGAGDLGNILFNMYEDEK